jgi:hypothetical protein
MSQRDIDGRTADEEMLSRIKRGLAENSARFGPKIIVYEGMGGLGALRVSLFEALQRLGWRADGEDWYPPEGQTSAYADLCAAVSPAPGIARENLQPLIEGAYPEGDVWLEEFGSYPELRLESRSLALAPAPMTPLQHVRYLKDRAEAVRLRALSVKGTPVSSVAADLEKRAEEIGRENSLPSAASDGWR